MASLSIIGNSQTAEAWTISAVLFCFGIVLGVFLFWHEVRAKDPLIDIELMKGKPFVAANAYNVVYGAALIGIMSLAPTYAVSVYGMSTFESGFILTPRSIGMIVASLIASHYISRWGYRWPMVIGTSIIAIGFVLLSLEPNSASVFGLNLNTLTLLMTMMLLMGLGIGIVSPAANNACIELMPQRVASITGLRGMFRQLGGVVSVTIATLLLHLVGNMARGFSIICIAIALGLLLSISFIFAMPSSPHCDVPPGQASSTQ
jgi:MFS family permease